MSRPGIVMYRVVYELPSGSKFRLETTDQDKIGPWLAEMFGLFPWSQTWSPGGPVSIETSNVGNY